MSIRRFAVLLVKYGLLLGALLVTAGVSALTTMRAILTSQEVPVPGLIGRRVTEAGMIAERYRLSLRVEGRRHDPKVAADRIAVDPGIGFAKRPSQSLRVLATLPRLAEWGFPVLVGASRKRFVADVTGIRAAAARVHGSVGAAVAAYERGARILRVHDVAATRQALDVADAIRRAGVEG